MLLRRHRETRGIDPSSSVEEEATKPLKGEALDAALKERGLPLSGTADEKRARLSELI